MAEASALFGTVQMPLVLNSITNASSIRMDGIMTLIMPHGGKLKDLAYKTSQVAESWYDYGDTQTPSWYLTSRQLCDLELLLSGGFSPLDGFLTSRDYNHVVANYRLADGTLWPMPITLDVSTEFSEKLRLNQKLYLLDSEGVTLAVMQVEDIWRPDKQQEAVSVFGTDDQSHPGVNYLFEIAGSIYVGGKLIWGTLPKHYDFQHLRMTPAQLREMFGRLNWHKIVAFQTRNPMHRAHQELTYRAAKQYEANLLIHPVVGMTKSGDIDYFTRVKCYELLLQNYPSQSTQLSLLPLAMRMAGPVEALWHAIIRKNYGCSHFIVGRDHAGPGVNKEGKNFYSPYAAQELVKKYEAELDILMVPFQEMVYVENKQQYLPDNELNPEDKVLNISGTEFRRRLQLDIAIPEWFSYPEVIKTIRKTYPAKSQQGFTLFFTGLPSAGKSTLAKATLTKLMEITQRSITLLDGDEVRKMLSSELGFSPEHRNLNILRIGYVASEVTKHRGIALCAPIAPYADARQKVRERISKVGGFIEIYVSTPLTVCEQRDRKGFYKKAREGLLKDFTGISSPYEIPLQPELEIDTSNATIEECVQQIISKLENLGYLVSIYQ